MRIKLAHHYSDNSDTEAKSSNVCVEINCKSNRTEQCGVWYRWCTCMEEMQGFGTPHGIQDPRSPLINEDEGSDLRGMHCETMFGLHSYITM